MDIKKLKIFLYLHIFKYLKLQMTLVKFVLMMKNKILLKQIVDI